MVWMVAVIQTVKSKRRAVQHRAGLHYHRQSDIFLFVCHQYRLIRNTAKIFGSPWWDTTLLSKYWRYNSLTRPPTLYPNTCLLWICTCWWRERRITSTFKHKPELPGMWSYKRDQILSLIRSFLAIRPSSLSNPFSLTHVWVVLTLFGWAPSRVDHQWCVAVIISHELPRLWVAVWTSHSLRWGESFPRHARLHLNRSSRQGREGRSRK